MFSPSNDELIEATLEFVNMIRADQGRDPLVELPRGVPMHGSQCPVARAINGDYQASASGMGVTWVEPGKIHRYEPPQPVVDFMHRFDNGRIQQLIDPDYEWSWPSSPPHIQKDSRWRRALRKLGVRV